MAASPIRCFRLERSQTKSVVDALNQETIATYLVHTGSRRWPMRLFFPYYAARLNALVLRTMKTPITGNTTVVPAIAAEQTPPIYGGGSTHSYDSPPELKRRVFFISHPLHVHCGRLVSNQLHPCRPIRRQIGLNEADVSSLMQPPARTENVKQVHVEMQ
jgi:hypothetical protein